MTSEEKRFSWRSLLNSSSLTSSIACFEITDLFRDFALINNQIYKLTNDQELLQAILDRKPKRLVWFYGTSTIVVECQIHFYQYKRVLFQTIQLSINTHFSSIWPIDRTLSGAITLGQSGPGRDSNERALRIPQHYWDLSTRLFDVISRTLVDSNSSAEKQSVYSMAPAD